MASATMTSFSMRFFTPSLTPNKSLNGSRLPNSLIKGLKSLKLSSSQSISGVPSVLSLKKLSAPQRVQPFTVFAAKGYKMKTHKASAKRFRVTGNGKIVRRRAGKQHLLWKKNTKRRNRLSKTLEVSRSDYNNVVSCLPYLKVNRLAK